MSSSLPSSATREHKWILPLVFVASFVAFYLCAVPLLDDADVPWHLAAGKLLLSTHALPQNDPWSFANAQTPWYLLSWLWDLLLGIVEKCAGLFGVLTFTIAIYAALITALTSRLIDLRIHPSAICFTVLLAILCLQDFLTARPHLSGYVLAFIFHALLHKSRDQNRIGMLWSLPALMLLWTNMHGSFIAGFTVLGAYLIEAFIIKNTAWLKRLIVISALCLITSLMNPYGYDIMTGAMKTLGGQAKAFTIEWLPYAFTISTGVSTWLLVFILAGNLRGSRAALADKLLAVGWLIATLFIMRNGALFILLSAPYLATCIDEASAGLRETRKPSPVLQWLSRQKRLHLWAASMLAFAVIVSFFYHQPHQQKLLSDNASVDDAIEYAQKHYPTHKYLTDFNFGGQVIYRTQGSLPFFMDSRAATAYSAQAMEDYIEFLKLSPDWQKRMDAYGINAIMVAKDVHFVSAYEQGSYRDRWKLVFAGRVANVYIRTP